MGILTFAVLVYKIHVLFQVRLPLSFSKETILFASMENEALPKKESTL